MTERYVFPIHFDAHEMRAAVNAFACRALFREKPLRTLAPLALIALSSVGLAHLGEAEDGLFLFFGALTLLAVVAGGGWRMQQRIMREKVEKARGHFSSARLSDEGVVIEAGGAAPLLPWKQIKAIWPGEKVWLLIVATNHFIALPIERAPREALAFIKGRVGGSAAA